MIECLRSIWLTVALAALACGRLGFEQSPALDDGGDGGRGDGGRGEDGGATVDGAGSRFDAAPSAACLAACPTGVCDGDTCVFQCGAADCPEVICPADLPCRVACPEADSCPGPIDCSAAASCEVSCAGRFACAGLIDCQGTAQCRVDCSAQDTCGGPIECGTGDCDVTCLGARSCDGAIDAAGACAADVTCSGSQTCPSVTCPSGCQDDPGCSSAMAGCDQC